MKYYIDTEFHEFELKSPPLKVYDGYGNPKIIDLISIGIYSEYGHGYYAVCKDFDIKRAWDNVWIHDNVLMPILYGMHRTDYGAEHARMNYTDYTSWMLDYKDNMYVEMAIVLINKYGLTRERIAEDIEQFCQPISGTDRAQFYGYFSSYDWVVFCQLWDSMLELPKHFNQFPVDLRVMGQLVADREFNDILFDEQRFKLLKMEADDKIPRDNRHIASFDAKWNMDFDGFITTFHK